MQDKKRIATTDTYHLERMLGEIEDYAIIFLNADGTINRWNKGAETIKGYNAEEVQGRHFSLFYTDKDKLAGVPGSLLQTAREQGKATDEGWRVRKNGSLFWGMTVITALHDDNNEVIGFAKMTRDLTERKLAEDNLAAKNQQLERTNAELSSFAYIASHDLQEPLRKIQTFLSRISDLEQGKLSERSVDFFNRIQLASQRMQQLIDDLLSYSRMNPDKDKYQEVDLNEIISAVQNDLSETIAEKRAQVNINTSLPVVTGIPFQLAQLFTNLITNALKFSKVEVPPVIDIVSMKERNASGKTFHRISVSDNGIGFEPAYSSKIFELFHRLHGRSEYAGTGIGLAICKKIAENHDGHIEAEGIPGKGATFHLYVPAR
ncbi:MAG TPA: ATP-binding protein [Chryseosolibacter sp.]|nr:ATP-binding protein [Chryseosolibacter sp.]